jgi:general secretion pathway protein K
MNFNGNIVHQSQRGAVLLAVLVISLILILLLSAAHSVMSSRLSLATMMVDLSVEKAAVHAKMQELIYLASTQRKTRAGISQGSAAANANPSIFFTGDELRADGHVYSSEINAHTIRYSIQAGSGLIPINNSRPYWLKIYLGRLGLSDFEIGRLIDRLADFADDDDFIRPLGGEGRETTKERLLQVIPPNFLLQHPSEVSNIQHWQDLLNKHPNMLSHLSIRRDSTLNVNAIPLDLLRILLPSAATKLYKNRSQEQWLINHADGKSTLAELLLVDDIYVAFGSSVRYVIEVSSKSANQKITVLIGKGSQKPFIYYIN